MWRVFNPFPNPLNFLTISSSSSAMSIYRVLSRASRSFTLLSALQKPQPLSTTFFHNFSSVPHQSANKLIPIQANLFGPSTSSSLTPRFGFSSSASSESSKTSEEANATERNEEDNGEDQAKESDAEIESDLSRDELIKLVTEKEALLKLKHKPKPKTNNGYGPTPKIEKPKSEETYKPNPTKPGYETPKPKTNYEYVPAPKIEKPKLDIVYIPLPTKPYYESPKPKESYQVQLSTVIGVQGTVLCKSGSNYYPIQGAVARVKCECVNELGYQTGPITLFSHVTDSKGYYFATLSLPGLGSKLKINECKAYLESSPLETCKVPTDVNHGISGASLSYYRLLDNNFKLYSVAPFFYTSQAKPVPGY